MSLTILNRKLDALNEKERRLRQTYDVRGKNKFQHRYINDLKEDFKEDLILRYGNKPYGLGWHENELAEEEEEAMAQEEEKQENLDDINNDQVEEEDEENEGENDDIITTGLMSSNNFRPQSGKVNLVSPQHRPFSASAARPMTASSAKGLNSNSQAFMFNNRPISAIAAKGQKGAYDSSDFQFGLVKSLQNTHQGFFREGNQNLQGSTSHQDLNSKMRVNEAIFWKNTKKFDISKSTKSFDTKRLLFESQHSNPKLLASSDLKFLREAKIGSTLEASKLKAPENYEFEDIALSQKQLKTEKTFTEIEETEKLNSSVESDAKVTFNQSLSYIQFLRIDTPTDGSRIGNMFSPHEGSSNRIKKLSRPFTAHPTIPSSTSAQKKTLDIIVEHTPQQQSRRLYFSSLSDIRKKTFFLKLYSIESSSENHPNSSKELKLVQWEAFRDITNKEEFQSLHLIISDLNNFDHAKYELEFQKGGGLKVKDKDGYKPFGDVYKEFVELTKTNLTSVIVYYETTTNKMFEVFSRIIVYEKQENEYEIQVWRNIYRYILHTLVLANSPLYPEARNYHDLSRIIKEIIEDRSDFVSPLSKQIQKMKDHPIIIERNGHVYNFDFHSYILECSSFYARVLEHELNGGVDEINHGKPKKSAISDKKTRPFSATASKDKLLSSGGKQIQAFQRADLSGDSNTSLEPLLIPSPIKGNSSAQGAARVRPETASVVSRNISGNLNRIVEEPYDYERPASSRRENERRNLSPFMPKAPGLKLESPDMTLKGGRMEILQALRYPPNTSQSMRSDPFAFNNFMKPMEGSYHIEYPYQAYSSSQVTSPQNFGDVFQKDSNGVTVRYKKSMVKKKGNIVIKRPQSGVIKKSIEPHNPEKHLTINGLGSTRASSNSSGNLRNGFRFKF